MEEIIPWDEGQFDSTTKTELIYLIFVINSDKHK